MARFDKAIYPNWTPGGETWWRISKDPACTYSYFAPWEFVVDSPDKIHDYRMHLWQKLARLSYIELNIAELNIRGWFHQISSTDPVPLTDDLIIGFSSIDMQSYIPNSEQSEAWSSQWAMGAWMPPKALISTCLWPWHFCNIYFRQINTRDSLYPYIFLFANSVFIVIKR